MLQPNRSCVRCLQRERAICSPLTVSELSQLQLLSRKQKLGKGQSLIWVGDENLLCGNLLCGVLKITASTANGREQIVGLLYPSDFVGFLYLEEAEFTVTALADAELCVFPRPTFQKLLEDHPEMERLLLRRSMEALSQSRHRMLMLARTSAEVRVASFLLEIAGRMRGQEVAKSFELPLTRGQIAEVLGLTIETVSRQLTRLKTAGVIRVSGARTVVLLDQGELKLRAEAA